ncbi:NAD-dependent epimerase/dehydratase family protein [Microbacterium testaceum]|uniref:NAD-dependent epimerase/dehydratase family protein n=1 Tax=Microbacterium testaceum TaxID=2033 RepID=UPI0025AF31CC|nr:NAD-dependent epimerase/dehydratase family protein [Microbacterium testaceum]WJS91775.1 NAD-dependent epimerase/dehydratase family protein [Microbacterium testaceum]
MRVLATGSSGFLGRAVVRALQDAGHEVRTLQRRPSGVDGADDRRGSVTDPDAVASALEGIDGVVHLAAKVSLAGDPAQFRAVNVEGTRILLDAAAAAGVSRVVHVSSPPSRTPATPSRVWVPSPRIRMPRAANTPVRRPRPRFSLSRAPAETPPSWRSARTSCGARATRSSSSASSRVPGTLPLLDGGTALIDSTFVDNAASGIVAALHRVDEVSGRAYVLTNGEPRPVGDLLAGICRASGVTPPRFSVPAGVAKAAGSLIERVWAVRPGQDEPPMTRFLAEQLSTAHWFDQTEIRRDLHWAPSVSIDEGLRRLSRA